MKRYSDVQNFFADGKWTFQRNLVFKPMERIYLQEKYDTIIDDSLMQALAQILTILRDHTPERVSTDSISAALVETYTDQFREAMDCGIVNDFQYTGAQYFEMSHDLYNAVFSNLGAERKADKRFRFVKNSFIDCVKVLLSGARLNSMYAVEFYMTRHMGDQLGVGFVDELYKNVFVVSLKL